MSTRKLLPLILLFACTPADDEAPAGDDAAPPQPIEYGEDLPAGDLFPEDRKADGHWGHALDCKPVPDLPPLEEPEIHLSLGGLTLRLVDHATGFEKVYPVGAGVIDHDESSRTYGQSLSAFPLEATRQNRFRITPRTIQPCKTWHTPTGVPLFAGLPFLSFYGNYGIHGPIDNYRSAHGGDLRRGYVSHGCFRMEAADISEVYARIKGVAEVPVYLHREAERDAEGRRVDVPEKWIGAECETDDECGDIEGGYCEKNDFSGRGWCTTRCERFCPDKEGYPGTFCVADPAGGDEGGGGYCVNREQRENVGCAPYDHFVPATMERFGQPGLYKEVCVPGTRGFIGDGCRVGEGDCLGGNECAPVDGDRGQCVQACSRYCPDMPGYASTFCVDEPLAEGDGGACVRTCDPERNAPECGAGMECVARARIGQPDRIEHVCLPL